MGGGQPHTSLQPGCLRGAPQAIQPLLGVLGSAGLFALQRGPRTCGVGRAGPSACFSLPGGKEALSHNPSMHLKSLLQDKCENVCVWVGVGVALRAGCRRRCSGSACARAEISQVVHLLLQPPCSCQPVGAVCCGHLVVKRFFGAGLGLVLLRCVQPGADPVVAEVCRQSAALGALVEPQGSGLSSARPTRHPAVLVRRAWAHRGSPSTGVPWRNGRC